MQWHSLIDNVPPPCKCLNQDTESCLLQGCCSVAHCNILPNNTPSWPKSQNWSFSKSPKTIYECLKYQLYLTFVDTNQIARMFASNLTFLRGATTFMLIKISTGLLWQQGLGTKLLSITCFGFKSVKHGWSCPKVSSKTYGFVAAKKNRPKVSQFG